VTLDCPDAEVEALGDLLVAEARGDEPQHVDLAGAWNARGEQAALRERDRGIVAPVCDERRGGHLGQ
jgi:hypothetical protein